MRTWPVAIALLLSCAACSQEDAPAEDIAEAAEQLVAGHGRWHGPWIAS